MKWLRLPTVMAVMTLSCAIGPAIRPQSAAGVSGDGMFLEGEVGDYIVGPMHLPLTAPALTPAAGGSTDVVTVSATEYGHTFTITFAAADADALAVGTYENAQEFPLQAAGHPGLSLYGDGKDCSSSTGLFMVDDISFDGGGNLVTFAARWEYHCEGAEAASFGAMSINSAVPYRRRTSARSLSFPGTLVGVPTASQNYSVYNVGPAPLHVSEVVLTGADAASFEITANGCTNVTLPALSGCPVAVRYTPLAMGTHAAKLTVFDDVSPNTGGGTGEDTLLTGGLAATSMSVFIDGEAFSVANMRHITSNNFTVHSDPAGVHVSGTSSGIPFTVLITAPTGETLTTGTYEGAHRSASAGVPALDVSVDSLGCNTGSGRFIVDDLVLQDGLIIAFAARWEHHCDGQEPADFGAVTYNSDVTYPERTIDYRGLDFGSVPRGESRVLPVTISNLGPAPHHVTSATIAGTSAGAFSVVGDLCSGTTVAAGSSCTIQVSFHSTGNIGARTARLTFYDDIAPNSGGGTGQDIPLGGTVASSAGEFTPLTPARVLDTRNGTGAPKAPIGQRASIQVQIAGRGGVPATGVTAVVMNVTAMNATSPTFVTIWPGTAPRPSVSNLNPVPGSVIPNQATVTLSYDGKVTAYNHNGTVNLVFDVVGFYADGGGPAGSRFHAVEPFRLFDTRDGTGGVPTNPIGAAETLSYDLDGAGGILPADGTTGVVLNVTFVHPTAPSYVTVYPSDAALPTASSLNLAPGMVRPNLVTVRVPADGVVKFYNAFGATDLIVDVVGYYDLTRLNNNSGRFVPVLAARAYDTRDYGITLGPDELGLFEIAGYDFVGVDLGATAVVLNVTAVTPTANGYLAAFPGDLCEIPTTSNVNFTAGQTIPNAVVVGLSTGLSCDIARGWIGIYNPFGNTHVIIDVAGWFM